LGSYYESLIELAYQRDYLPEESCGYPKLVLEKFKELALEDENYELVATIQKELDSIEEEK